MRLFKTFLFSLSLLFSIISSAQNFEGIIELTRTNYYDATKYIYYVSGHDVRIDEMNNDGEVTGTILVNLTTKKVMTINPKRKLYMEIKSNPSIKNLDKSSIKKTPEKKTILGHECSKWTVSNSDYKSTADYWLIDSPKYAFFHKLLKALNSKDRITLYFMKIPNNTDFFPITGEEKGFDGKLKAKLETKKIIQRKIHPEKFTIPTGYSEFKMKG